MTFPEQAAQTPQPYSEPFAVFDSDLATQPVAAQSWFATVADAKYHWYDLIAGFPAAPDIRDPLGRYLRRMQFELDAAAEKHHLYFVVTRPRVRFDAKGTAQWGFFSLKLTLPLLLGAEGTETRDSITIELKVPFAATLKKPAVTLTASFVTLNWGGLIEVFSVHDVLQQFAGELKAPCKVVHVGQTRDEEGLLGKGRLPALQKLHQQHGDHLDTLLLVQRVELTVTSAEGDPADLARNATRSAAEALQRDRMDVIEAALIRHFEGTEPRQRNERERSLRCARLHEVKNANNLVQFTIDLQLEQEQAGNYRCLGSELVEPAARHLLSCYIADGRAQVAPLPLPPVPKGGKS